MNPDVQPLTLARYNHLRELGRGDDTVVDLVYDELRQIALARKRWENASAETRFRLKQQYRRASVVRHPNVVRLYDLCIDGDDTFLTMEAVSGTDVLTHLRIHALAENDNARFMSAAIAVLRQLSEALTTLHAAGIVHREVTPRNVLAEVSGRVVLLDAGFSWPPEGGLGAVHEQAATRTLPYLAPECLQGASPSAPSDWYGFGALAAELLTGRVPFGGDPAHLLLAKEQDVSSLRDVCPAIPPALDELVRALLQRDPQARPSAPRVEAALRELGRLQPRAPSLAPTQWSRAHGHDDELDKLESLLADSQRAHMVCIRGTVGVGKTKLARDFTERVRRRDDWSVFEALSEADTPLPFGVFHAISAQLSEQWSVDARPPLRADACSAAGIDALRRMLPETTRLLEAGGGTRTRHDDSEPQRQWVEGLLAFRTLWTEQARARRVLIVIDDWHTIQHDAGKLLQTLLTVEPRPQIFWLLVVRADQVLPDPMTLLLEQVRRDKTLPITTIDLSPAADVTASLAHLTQRSSAPPAANDADHHDRQDATAEVLTRRPTQQQLDELLLAAANATTSLALQRAADLQRAALELTSEPPLERVHAAAIADTRAGRLRDASKLWLLLARSSQDPSQAQRFELSAGAALLRAGDEEAGRAILQGVLRASGLRLPRAPLLTSTLERARLLLQGRRFQVAKGKKAAASRSTQCFDALWGTAKELALIAPAAGDALSVRALREALSLGDPSRLAWALGYEAASEANIGGSYMRQRARGLVAEAAALAQHSGDAYDAAYVASVQGVVAWFAGDWAAAEKLLRDALQRYASAAAPTAHEQHVLETFLVGALEAQGNVKALTELLPALRISAEQSGHQLAAAMCTLAEASLPSLARDRPLQAIARADSVLASFNSDAFTPLHFQHFIVTVSARLYAGHSAQAFRQVEQTWQRVSHSYLPRLDAAGLMLHQLRARAALSLAKRSPQHESERLAKLAAKAATAIGSSSLPHASALRHLIEANICALRGRRARAEEHCTQAAAGFERAGMPLMREITRAARASLADTIEAKHDSARSRAFFVRAGIHNPSAMVLGWFPAFADPGQGT